MNTASISKTYPQWEIPEFETHLWFKRKHPYCVVIPVINEGNRIRSLLFKMKALKIHDFADILIVDGGSIDNSINKKFLNEINIIRGLLIKTGHGGLSSQLRCAYAFSILEGYEGIVTIDGNDKDDPEAIPRFIEALKKGVDFIQGSRFIPLGVSENTPKFRALAINYIHAPLLTLFSGFKWTDTTQGFRAYSSNMLLDPNINPFREVFSSYELLAYLSYRAPKLGYKCLEMPTIRRYPINETPTKISGIKGNLVILFILFKTCLGAYNIKRV